ncbi:MAG TPA: DUF2784 domain-containing protein [Terriglobales bacterium]|nr:DUF2784 domain-containing protein [Terriglobales bacterium]
MNVYFLLAAAVLFLHLAFTLWVVFGALATRKRPLLGLFHVASLAYGILIEVFDWTCPLTPLENWLRAHAGVPAYQGGFLLHYLDALIYPDVSPSLLTTCGVAVCLFNLGVYAARLRRARRPAQR